MSIKEVKDAVEAVDLAQQAFRAANNTFADAKNARDQAQAALEAAQTNLGSLLDKSSLIGGDYILKEKGNG